MLSSNIIKRNLRLEKGKTEVATYNNSSLMLFDKRCYFKIILKQKQCIENYYLHQTKQTRGPVRTIKNKHNLRYANSTTTITEGQCPYVIVGGQ